jgi:transcriptional regulator
MRKNPKLIQHDSVTKLSIMKRHLKVLKLRLQGLTTRAIGDKLGVSAMTISRDLKELMQDLAKAELTEAKELQTLELARLDSLLEPIWEKATSGSTTHINAALKIIAERSKLLGFGAPKLQVKLIVEREVEVLMNVLETELPAELYLKILAKLGKVEIKN